MNSMSLRKRLASLASALLVAGMSSAQAAAPDNDNYASSTELLMGPIVTTSNVEAGLEANEPIPTGFTSVTYHGTVWWHWKPIFTGWYELNTEGSGINTVLSVWVAGADPAAPAYLVHVNDESKAGGVSRVQLYVDSQLTYKVAVAGKGPAQAGNISLHGFYIPDPFAKITAVQFVHSSVDVTSSASSVAATLTIEANREIESGKLTILTPEGLVLAQPSLSSANRIDGNVARGDYLVNFTVPRYICAGSYRWSASFANARYNKEASQGTEALSPLAYGMTTALTVSNNGIVDAYAMWRNQGLAAGVDASRLSLDRFAFGLGDGQGAAGPVMEVNGGLVRTGSPNIVVVTETGGGKRLRVQFVRRLNASQQGLTYTAQFSDDLKTWVNSSEPVQWLASDSQFEAVQVSDSVSTADAPRRFVRVLVNNISQP